MKTHTPWTYRMVEPGVYEWTTPHGSRLLVDHTGTRDLTPDVHMATGCLADPPDQ